MAWDDSDEEEEVVLAPQKKASEWSDEEEEEEDDESTIIAKLREEKATLLARLDEINDKLPMEQPKESSKKGKQMKKLVKDKEEEERRKAAEALAQEEMVSLQRRIEESDFDNAQDMFGGGKSGEAGGSDSGKFESWPLSSGTKQPEVEEFAVYTAAKITKFQKEFLYMALMRKLLAECTKEMAANEAKELLLVLTKGRKDFTALDLVRSLMREADASLTAEEIAEIFSKESGSSAAPKKAPKKGEKEKEKLTARQELVKLIVQDFIRDTKPELVARVVEEGCGVVLTRDQQSKIATKRAEMQGDPSLQKAAGKGSARVADHKSMDMYGAFGSGGGDDWGGGGGTRGDDVDFM